MEEKVDAYSTALYYTIKEKSVSGEYTASYTQIMELMHWSQDTVSRCMIELLASGKLVRLRGGKNRVPSTYKVV